MVIAITASVMGDWVAMAEPTTTTTCRAARCSKHAFAPSASFRPRNGGTGNVTLPAQRHQTGLWRAELASDSPEAGDDPVNEVDPTGYCGGWGCVGDFVAGTASSVDAIGSAVLGVNTIIVSGGFFFDTFGLSSIGVVLGVGILGGSVASGYDAYNYYSQL
jgi:hypothetical protein